MAETNNNNNDDPSNLVSKSVKVHSLTNRPDLNGSIGTVLHYSTQTSRYIVQLPPFLPHQQPRTASLRADNLIVASLTDRAMGRAVEIKNTAAFLFDQYRPQMNRLYGELDSRIPHDEVHPEHLGAVLGIMMLYLTYRIGLSKTILLSSIFLLLALVALPDVMAYDTTRPAMENVLIVLKNVPRRWKESFNTLLNGRTSYRLTDRVSNAFLLTFLLVCGRMLLWTPPVKTNAAAAAAASSSYGRTSRMTETLDRRWTVEEVYKMGYDDAKQDKDYKSSLYTMIPEDDGEIDTFESLGYFASSTHPNPAYTSSSSSYDSHDDYEDYVPPPQPRQNKFGIGTAMSLFALGRTVKDLGFSPNDGRFDLQLLIANVKNLEPWRLGLMGLALYRVVSAFM